MQSMQNVCDCARSCEGVPQQFKANRTLVIILRPELGTLTIDLLSSQCVNVLSSAPFSSLLLTRVEFESFLNHFDGKIGILEEFCKGSVGVFLGDSFPRTEIIRRAKCESPSSAFIFMPPFPVLFLALN